MFPSTPNVIPVPPSTPSSSSNVLDTVFGNKTFYPFLSKYNGDHSFSIGTSNGCTGFLRVINNSCQVIAQLLDITKLSQYSNPLDIIVWDNGAIRPVTYVNKPDIYIFVSNILNSCLNICNDVDLIIVGEINTTIRRCLERLRPVYGVPIQRLNKNAGTGNSIDTTTQFNVSENEVNLSIDLKTGTQNSKGKQTPTPQTRKSSNAVEVEVVDVVVVDDIGSSEDLRKAWRKKWKNYEYGTKQEAFDVYDSVLAQTTQKNLWTSRIVFQSGGSLQMKECSNVFSSLKGNMYMMYEGKSSQQGQDLWVSFSLTINTTHYPGVWLLAHFLDNDPENPTDNADRWLHGINTHTAAKCPNIATNND
jgi:hypothetical protein